MVAGLVGGAVGSANAEGDVKYFNPFAVNNGFTIVSQGDATLGNGELEGSIAAFGTIATTNTNGYPVIHNAAGSADYTVPLIDKTPVRILAEELVGTGAFELTNRDDSGTIAVDSPEANAVAKLVTTDGLTGTDRSGFLRVSNTAGGLIDLTKVQYTDSDLSPYQTTQSSVASYFEDVDNQVAQINQCLTSMYDSDLVHEVDLNEQYGMLYPSGFATDRPNVINYDDVAGKTIKMDNAGGWQPTAQAPLVIRVAPGTTTIGPINIEGWSPSKDQQQSLARYIMLDLSKVTGTVTIDGLELGAIWAPSANLTFTGSRTTNGQWYAGGNVSTSGGGEVHHHTFMGNLPCASTPEVPVPAIGTSVSVEGSQDKVLPVSGGTVVDTVSFEGLTPGTEYVVSGTVMAFGEDGSVVATDMTGSASFTPESAVGTVDVTFTVSAEQAAAYAGQSLVVFEKVTAGGDLVASHEDPEDEAQTFTVDEPEVPDTPTPSEPVTPTPSEPGTPTPSEPVTPTPSTPGEPELPKSGADMTGYGLATILLLGAGAAVLGVRRKMSLR